MLTRVSVVLDYVTLAEIVINYADMMLVLSATTQTGCQQSHGPRGHDVNIVNDQSWPRNNSVTTMRPC